MEKTGWYNLQSRMFRENKYFGTKRVLTPCRSFVWKTEENLLEFTLVFRWSIWRQGEM